MVTFDFQLTSPRFGQKVNSGGQSQSRYTLAKVNSRLSNSTNEINPQLSKDAMHLVPPPPLPLRSLTHALSLSRTLRLAMPAMCTSAFDRPCTAHRASPPQHHSVSHQHSDSDAP